MEQEKIDAMLMDRAIPGQSLTNDPASPMPFERAPEFTNMDEAQEYLFEKMTENGDAIISLLGKDITVVDIALMALMKGFSGGKWNPDLMMLLIEPAIYIVLFIAEQGGVDYTLDDEDLGFDEDELMLAETGLVNMAKKATQKVDVDNIESMVPQAPSLLAPVENT